MSRSVRLPCTRSGSRHGTALPSWLLLSADARRVRDTHASKTIGRPLQRHLPSEFLLRSKSRGQTRASSGIGLGPGLFYTWSRKKVARLEARVGVNSRREVQRLVAESRAELSATNELEAVVSQSRKNDVRVDEALAYQSPIT